MLLLLLLLSHFSRVRLWATPQTAAHQAPLSLSCPILCHPIDGSPPGSPVPGILQASLSEAFLPYLPAHTHQTLLCATRMH